MAGFLCCFFEGCVVSCKYCAAVSVVSTGYGRACVAARTELLAQLLPPTLTCLVFWRPSSAQNRIPLLFFSMALWCLLGMGWCVGSSRNGVASYP